jgi:hypothetical protein
MLGGMPRLCEQAKSTAPVGRVDVALQANGYS